LTISTVFRTIINRAKPLYVLPTEELLSSILYEPSTVAERGWVVTFNYLLLHSVPSHDPPSRSLKTRLRWNSWLALNDSTLFLEPCEANILALLSIASHGEDFSTPNLSWILVSHACRLAQAMNIQMSTRANDQLQSHRLFLFWTLFIIDKSMSLAFGRPPAMSGSYYEHVPIPDMRQLMAFSPHVRSSSNEKTMASTFGAIFFLRGLALAKITGHALDLLHNLEALDHHLHVDRKQSLLVNLREWYLETCQVGSTSLFHPTNILIVSTSSSF
jgi:hypothetical protein